jgi:hypothetical protein
MTSRKPDEGAKSPYCAFRSDRERLWALISRDIRWVLVVGLMAITNLPVEKLRGVLQLFGG